MKTLTIVSPVYQEAEVIAAFYRELKAELDKLRSYASTVLFVVDRGEDNTLNILKDICTRDPAVRVLGMSSRFGHQISLLAGIDHADSDLIIMMDSDLQHPPAIIPKLLAEFELGNDIVTTIRENTEHIGVFKRLSSRLFYLFINSISDVQIEENAPDFRLISRRVALIIREQVRERNFFLRGIIPWLGFKQKTIRFSAAARPGGKSKYSISRLMQLGIAGIVSFSRKPLRAATFAGVLSAGIAFILALLMLLRFFIFGRVSSVLAISATLILLFSGIQFIFLGILGEYIGAIFEEVKERPRYIVDEKINF
ncbi:MAG: glycosyltransferase family 2 protein [bacterium]|nr:glycosyltransferase family 2 protein [bacterium]